jgi:hypothetical protein
MTAGGVFVEGYAVVLAMQIDHLSLQVSAPTEETRNLRNHPSRIQVL